MNSLEKAWREMKNYRQVASWWATPLPSRALLSTLQAKKQISRTFRITKLRKVDYKIRLQIYTSRGIKKNCDNGNSYYFLSAFYMSEYHAYVHFRFVSRLPAFKSISVIYWYVVLGKFLNFM